MMFLTIVSIMLFLFSFIFLFYNITSQQVKDSLKNEADFISSKYDIEMTISKDFLRENEFRYTLLEKDGDVLYDSIVEPGRLENHVNREEIIEAVSYGNGYSKRYSTTLKSELFYYAETLKDGNIIRISKEGDSIFGLLVGGIPLTFILMVTLFIICKLLANILTEKMLNPLNNIDFESDLSLYTTYDELQPFVTRIAQQKQKIEIQTEGLLYQISTTNTILENMQEGLVLVDSASNVLLANQTAQKLLQSNSSVPTGKTVLELTRRKDIVEYIKEALSGKSNIITINFEKEIYQVMFNPTNDCGCAVLFINITEKLIAEKIRHEFSANVSHELRTPLASISGYAEIISSGLAKEHDIKMFAEKIRVEAARLLLLIEDILKISQLDEQISDVVTEKIDIFSLARTVSEELAEKAKTHKVKINLTGSEVFVSGQRNHFYEILLNLIDNSIKYNKPNGSVDIEVSHKCGKVVIRVKDTGIGIPDDDQLRIFERFYRVDKSRSKKTGGTGLGLSIVKHIVNHYKGQIYLESKIGEGTLVEITLQES